MEIMLIAAFAVIIVLLGVIVYLVTRSRELPPGKEPAQPVLPPPEHPAVAEKGADGAIRESSTTAAVRPTNDGFFHRLVQGLSKTQTQLIDRFDSALRGRKEIDASLYEELETVLLTADVGVRTTQHLLDGIKRRADREALKDPALMRGMLRAELQEILRQPGSSQLNLPPESPAVILIVGVNGVGKTTTIGKLASRFSREGKRVIMAAGDTFRAAAIEQLEVWGERSGATVIRNKEGADPSAVIYDAILAATARGVDIVIADTAGRLHNKTDLMDELKKVTRVIGKARNGAPHEVLLVLDATMGQNALEQARVFHQDCKISGLVLTKLDGTAKGGVIIGISHELKLPVKFIGIGEKVDDLQPFDPEAFVEALF